MVLVCVVFLFLIEKWFSFFRKIKTSLCCEENSNFPKENFFRSMENILKNFEKLKSGRTMCRNFVINSFLNDRGRLDRFRVLDNIHNISDEKNNLSREISSRTWERSPLRLPKSSLSFVSSTYLLQQAGLTSEQNAKFCTDKNLSSPFRETDFRRTVENTTSVLKLFLFCETSQIGETSKSPPNSSKPFFYDKIGDTGENDLKPQNVVLSNGQNGPAAPHRPHPGKIEIAGGGLWDCGMRGGRGVHSHSVEQK